MDEREGVKQREPAPCRREMGREEGSEEEPRSSQHLCCCNSTGWSRREVTVPKGVAFNFAENRGGEGRKGAHLVTTC